jgi:short-subunit dehydrogenase
MKNWMDNKHALITGASEGLGKEITRNLANGCRKLTLIARDDGKLKKLEQELYSTVPIYKDIDITQTNLRLCPMDIRDTNKMQDLIKQIYEEDKDHVDVFINCAGGSHVIQYFEDMNQADIAQILDTNLKAPILWLRELLPYMKNNINYNNGDLKKGHILMMSSRSAERALPRLSVYAAAKGTIDKFIEAIQREYAQYGLAFTLVAPGSINTSFTAKWPKKDKDSHNLESMTVEEAVEPILQALNSQYATNRISYESIKQWRSELGVVKSNGNE